MKFKINCFRCFSALSTKARVEIIKLLQKKDRMSVLEITNFFHISQPTVTHHLKYLKQSGILKSEREGRRVYYFLSPLCPKNECNIFL